MKRLASAFALAALALAADLPSGDSIIERCIEKSGGAEAFAKIRSTTMIGTVEFVGHNLTGPVTMYQKGDKTYTVIELPGIGKIEEGYDGTVAWEMNAIQGARIKEGEEKSAAVRSARMNSLSSWRDVYKDAKTTGEESVDGKPAWKVELSPKEGKPETFFFDKESGMMVRMTQTVSTALGEIPAEASIGDYRRVDGILAPFSMIQKAMNQTIAMRFEKIVWNPEIPADRFDLPAPVKALQNRKKP